MKITPYTILGLVLSLIFLTVLLSVSTSTIPVAATAFHNLSDNYANNAAIYGTEAAAFGGQVDGYMGWFWVIGPFALVVLIVIGLFVGRKGRRR